MAHPGRTLGAAPERERRLVVNADHYRVLSEMVREAILTLDLGGRVVTANRAAERIFGFAPRDLVGKPFDLLVPGYRERITLEPAASEEDGAARHTAWDLLQLEGKRRSGEAVPLEVSFSAFQRDGETLIAAVAREMSDLVAARSEAAAENARLYREAERAVETRDSFAAVVSHELRNLLAVILMKTELLRRGVATPESQSEAIQRSGERMKRLIDDLLDLASLEAARFLVDHRPHDAEAILAEAHEQLLPFAEAKGVKLERNAAPGLPFVDCDRERILQVLSNLGANAVKFTPEGGTIVLSAALQGQGVRFSVRDTGCGIPEAQIPRIFDRFSRVKQGYRQGAGLGLSIVKGIVEAHGGHIGVVSQPGDGSEFFFTLQAAREPQ